MNDVIRTSNELDEIVSHADLLLKSGDEVLSLTPDEWRKIRKATGVDTDLLKSALGEAFDWLCPPNGVGAAGDALREYLLRILPLIDMSTNTVLGKSVHAHETLPSVSGPERHAMLVASECKEVDPTARQLLAQLYERCRHWPRADEPAQKANERLAGCRNWKPKHGVGPYCGNCGFHENEHADLHR